MALNKIKNNINENLKKYINKNNLFKEYLNDIIGDGKRIRPIISYIIFDSLTKLCNDNKYKYLDSFLIPEILHNISLIIDDLPCMDNDLIRRNKLTIHNKYGVHSTYFLCIELINSFKNIFDKQNRNIKIINYMEDKINEINLEMLNGQYLDLNYINICFDKNILFKINKLKTAPLFKLSFIIPYLVYLMNYNINIEEKVIESLENMGEYFGILYQMSDDYIDQIQDKEKKQFNLNFFISLGEKNGLEQYQNYKNKFIKELKKQNIYNSCFKEIIELLDKRIYG